MYALINTADSKFEIVQIYNVFTVRAINDIIRLFTLITISHGTRRLTKGLKVHTTSIGTFTILKVEVTPFTNCNLAEWLFSTFC